jgi:hypothetical protein
MRTALLREHHLQPNATISKRNLPRTNIKAHIIGCGRYSLTSSQ